MGKSQKQEQQIHPFQECFLLCGFVVADANSVQAKGWKWVSLILHLKLLAAVRHSQDLMRPLPRKIEQKRDLKKK